MSKAGRRSFRDRLRENAKKQGVEVHEAKTEKEWAAILDRVPLPRKLRR